LLPSRSLIAVKVHAHRLQLPRRSPVEGKLMAPGGVPRDDTDPSKKKTSGDTSAPTPVSSSDKAKMRKCLRCEGVFYSAWAGDRICGNCRRSDDWQSGDPWFVSHGPSVE
jgi:hypothetical protein